ncbi:hypothetical protein [Xenorhabdus szentirmaii]|uniref:hypothetical protein n=1 Tax=Xenorhabdus szentirmaii TaxID=290112 RepID=UPI002B414FBA|nr:hypothetical protein [Xenorhabdus sp. 38]
MKNRKESLYLQERAYLRELAQRAAKESSHLTDFLATTHDPIFNVFSRRLLTLNPDCYANPGEMYRFCRLIHKAMACFVSQSTFVKLGALTLNQKILWEFKEIYGARMAM